MTISSKKIFVFFLLKVFLVSNFFADGQIVYAEEASTDEAAAASADSTSRLPSITFHHYDHLSGTSVSTDRDGNIVEVVDYYPFGEVRLEEKAEDYENDYKFTGKELDEETNLYYYGARYYDPAIGRFVSVDNAVSAIGNEEDLKNITGKDQQSFLANPQGLNAYSYVQNNPLKYVDPTGNAFETAFDVISLALSLYDFDKDPSLWNGAFAVTDGAAVLFPGAPAAFGYIKHGARMIKIGKYFRKISKLKNVKASVFQISKKFLKNIGFKFSRRAWSIGEANNDVASLVGHFVSHGEEVGAKSLRDYYNKANDLIDSVKNGKGYKFSGKRGDFEYFNPKSGLLVVTDSSGKNIRTFRKPGDNKLKELQKRVEKHENNK